MNASASVTFQHPKHTLVLGCGSVAQCAIPLMIRDLKFDPKTITIVDTRDNRHRVADVLAMGVSYELDGVTRENLDSFLSARVGNGDILLDLAWNIDGPTIIEWCRDHGVRYLNTSVELWDPYHDMQTTTPQDRTLYVRHQEMRKMIERWGSNNGPSAVVEHGANPGMVSHLVKRALVDITTAYAGSTGNTITIQTAGGTALATVGSASTTPLAVGRATTTLSGTNMATILNVGTSDLVLQVIYACAGTASGGAAQVTIQYVVKNSDGTANPSQV